MALQPNFRRYAMSIQYHGSAFLGFSYQGPKCEDCIAPDGTDLRGYVSVEGRLRRALASIVPSEESFANIQVSSRTDRGVHAIKNTLHIDLRDDVTITNPPDLQRALNYCLRRHKVPHIHEQDGTPAKSANRIQKSTQVLMDGDWVRHNPNADLRILDVQHAPSMLPNPVGAKYYDQPPAIDWNARYSTIERTYVYQILRSNNNDWAAPFAWDRTLRIDTTTPLDIAAMQRAATDHLVGCHDFTSFRAAHCGQKSPVVHIREIRIDVEPYRLLGTESSLSSCELISITIRADSFLYRQVRNIVGCLLRVGQGKLMPDDVRDIRLARDRRVAPLTVPAHGLFLLDVKHQGIQL